MDKYDHLKDKLDERSKDAEILTGENGMIELDPDNPHHKEWFEDDYIHDPKESLKHSLIQMKLIREGKLPRITWEDYYDEIKNDKEQ